MNRKNETYRLVLAGLLVGVGLLLPFVTAHTFGMAGTVFLPMHLPVFLIGLLCGPMYGAVGGVLIPVLSSLLTGMPSLFPMLPIMAVELLIFGLVSGLLYQKAQMKLYPSLLLSMLCGWAAYALVFQVLLFAGHGELKALSVTAALLQGIPGIAVQLILIPPIVAAVNRRSGREAQSGPAVLALEKAKRMIRDETASCVLLKDGKIICTGKGQGIAPLISIYENNPGALQGAFVVDKVIGKAAAMMIVLGGAKQAYGAIMSTSACEYLAAHGCGASYGERIDIVSNRAGDGICPLEQSVLTVDDPEAGYHILKETICRLRSAG
jgi:hypothetical protein